MNNAQKITVLLIEGNDKVSKFARWLGFGQYVAVGFVYPTNMGRQRDTILLFNTFNHSSPVWADNLTIDNLLSLPHLNRARCHKLSVTDKDMTTFRLTISIALSDRSKIQLTGEQQIASNLKNMKDAPGKIVNGFTLVNQVLCSLGNVKDVVHDRLIETSILGPQYDLTLKSSNQRDKIDEMNRSSLLDLMHAFTTWSTNDDGPSLDLHPKMEVDKASDLLHEIFSQLGSDIPLLEMEKLINLSTLITGVPPKITPPTSSSGLIIPSCNIDSVSLIGSSLLLTSSGIDLKHVESIMLNQTLQYLNSLTEFDRRFIGLEQEIIKELAKRSKSDKH